MKIGENIKKFRKIRNFTQEELSLICGIHRNSLYKYENDIVSPSYEQLEKISTALAVPITHIVEYEDFEALYFNNENCSQNQASDLEDSQSLIEYKKLRNKYETGDITQNELVKMEEISDNLIRKYEEHLRPKQDEKDGDNE